MTLSTTTTRVQYDGNGSTKAFAFPYKFIANGDLIVELTDSNGDDTTQTITTHYTVSGAGNDAGGTVTMVTAPASGEKLTITRVLDIVQETDYVEGDDFPAETHEAALDYLTMVAQQLDDRLDRAVTLPRTVSATFNGELTPEASKVVGINASGTGFQLLTASDAGVIEETNTYLKASLSDGTIATPTDKFVIVGGRSSLGDGYEGMFYWDSSDLSTEVAGDTYEALYVPPDSDTTGASGAWVRMSNEIWTNWYNTSGDGVTDDSAKFQAAINHAVSLKKPLYTPYSASGYLWSSPVIIGLSLWTGSTWSGQASLTWKGVNVPFEELGNGVEITLDYGDTFAVGIQGGRAVHLENLSFIGTNDIESNYGSTPFSGLMTASNFIESSQRDTRYSPYAGICIDPFGTSTPADGGYPGLSYYATGAGGSSSLTFNTVNVENFVVGIVISPNGVTANAENIVFDQCSILHTKYAVSIAQSQARNVVMRSCDIRGCLIAFDGMTHGLQRGFAPAIHDLNLGYCKFVFNVPSGFGFPAPVDGLHCEVTASLGNIGTASTTDDVPVVIRNLHFGLNHNDGDHADLFMFSASPVVFDGFEISFASGIGATADDIYQVLRFFNPDFLKGSFTFKNGIFKGIDVTDNELALGLANTTRAQIGHNLIFENVRVSDGSEVHLLDHRYTTYADSAIIDGKYVPNYAMIHNSGATAGDFLVVHTANINEISEGTHTVTVGSNGKATFTATDPDIWRVGDQVLTATSLNMEVGTTTVAVGYWCMGMVTDISGSTITVTGIPRSMTTGSYDLYGSWWTRYHQPTTGDVTSGSATITNMSTTTGWSVGDKVQGTGINTGSHITAINATAATITLSDNATATNTGVDLYDARVYVHSGTLAT